MFDKVQTDLQQNMRRNGKDFVPCLKFIPSSMESSDNGGIESMSLSNMSRFRHLSSRNTPRASAREIERVEEDSLESICSSPNKKRNYGSQGQGQKPLKSSLTPQAAAE